MKEILIFIAGGLVGAWFNYSKALPGQSGEGRTVYLNGGAISSSTIGVIYGYADDMEGCTIHAAGMNFYFQSDEAMKRNILNATGNAFCSHEPIQ